MGYGMMKYGMMGYGMMPFMLLWWGIIISGFIFAVYGLIKVARGKKPDRAVQDVLEQLRLRLAAGEIAPEEYQKIKQVLES